MTPGRILIAESVLLRRPQQIADYLWRFSVTWDAATRRLELSVDCGSADEQGNLAPLHHRHERLHQGVDPIAFAAFVRGRIAGVLLGGAVRAAGPTEGRFDETLTARQVAAWIAAGRAARRPRRAGPLTEALRRRRGA